MLSHLSLFSIQDTFSVIISLVFDDEICLIRPYMFFIGTTGLLNQRDSSIFQIKRTQNYRYYQIH